MKFLPIFLIIFGVIVIINPEILAYLLGGLFIFLGINGLFLSMAFSKAKKTKEENFVKFGNYKIYR